MATSITKVLARRLAPKIMPGKDWSDVRCQVDSLTGGNLDTWRLDTLTDWVIEERTKQENHL